MEKRTVSVVEAGQMLGLSRGAAYEAVKRGDIPTLRFGKKLVVPLAALRRMLGEADRAPVAAETHGL